MDTPYKVIGYYVPPRWSKKLVAHDLEAMTKKIGLKPLPIGSYRLHKGPYQNYKKHSDLMRRRPKYDNSDTGWHQDGDMTNTDMDCTLVLWATNNPTEFRYEGEIWQPDPYQVVAANNLRCEHRRPDKA